MSEITRLASLIKHVGADQGGVHGSHDPHECSLCDDIREILADVMKRQETQEAMENPLIKTLCLQLEEHGLETHQAMATTTDRLNKQRSRIIQLEERALDAKRHLRQLDARADSFNDRIKQLEAISI